MQKWLRARAARPARLRHADADRGHDQAAQPEHRVRPLAEVEPAADRRQRGRAGRDRPAGRSGRSTTGARSGDAAAAPTASATTVSTPGPDVAEGWDDWGPFYTADVRPARRARRLDGRDVPAAPPSCGGAPARARSRTSCSDSTMRVRRRQPRARCSTTARDLPARRRRRAAAGVLPGAVRPRQQLDARVPGGVRHPGRRGPAQRRRGQPARRAGCCSTTSRSSSSSATTRTIGADVRRRARYVVRMKQPRRGLARHGAQHRRRHLVADQRLYAPPAAWSHGYLWGADIGDDPGRRAFRPQPTRIAGRPPARRRRAGRRDGYTLEIDSPTAVRTRSTRLRRGRARRHRGASFDRRARSRVSATVAATSAALEQAGEEIGLTFTRPRASTLPGARPGRARAADRGADRRRRPGESGSLRQLGFAADPVSTGRRSTRAPDRPAGQLRRRSSTGRATRRRRTRTARARLTAFFAARRRLRRRGATAPRSSPRAAR